MSKIQSRIASLDGLRAIAVLGVIWCHIVFFIPSRPVFHIWRIDFFSITGYLGTGVDLFFVISGFCMYLIYRKLMESFSFKGYFHFIKKRWLRIAPAFYITVIASAIFYYSVNDVFLTSSVLKHFLFLNTTPLQANNLSSPFWSLATEWQFYLVLPLLFLFSTKSKAYPFWLAFIYILTLIFRYFIYQYYPDSEDIWKSSIFFRLPEFIAGIYVAHFFLKGITLPALLSGPIGFGVGLIIAFLGRTLMGNITYVHLPQYSGIGKAFGEPILTMGYAILVWNVISSSSIFQKILESKPMAFLGKISYSMYLWHWWLLKFTTDLVLSWFSSLTIVYTFTYVFFLIMFIPFSYLSYILFE